jgi:hypothetical protein
MKTIDELRYENELLRQQLLIEGRDAPLTDMVYGKKPEELKDPTDVMPQNNGLLQGITDPLQKLINQFEPTELVSRQIFRKMLLATLNNWRDKSRVQAIVAFMTNLDLYVISKETAERQSVVDHCMTTHDILKAYENEKR